MGEYPQLDPPPDRPPVWRVGDRVRLSAAGRAVGLDRYHTAGRVGTVVGFSQDGYPRIRWDERSTASTYHPSYVERVE